MRGVCALPGAPPSHASSRSNERVDACEQDPGVIGPGAIDGVDHKAERKALDVCVITFWLGGLERACSGNRADQERLLLDDAGYELGEVTSSDRVERGSCCSSQGSRVESAEAISYNESDWFMGSSALMGLEATSS